MSRKTNLETAGVETTPSAEVTEPATNTSSARERVDVNLSKLQV